MTDAEINQMAHEVDVFIMNLVKKYNLDPLSASGVVLARLIKFNTELEKGDNFISLMNVIVNEGVGKTEETAVH